MPSKALIKAAEVAHHARTANEYGLKIEASIDTATVMNHVRSVVREVYGSHNPDAIRELGIDLFFGKPSFKDIHTLQVGDTVLRAKRFIIATGSSPFVPPIDGINDVSYLTNETLFDLERLPKSMIILGGGPIGIEMASALNRLGVSVTVVEMNDRILPHDEPELVTTLSEIMAAEGVSFLTESRATRVAQADSNGVVVTVERAHGQTQQIAAEMLLVATGRTPNSAGLGLEQIGVEVSRRGIVVDGQLRTAVSHIYAAGDVVGPYQFSHMAWYQAVVAARNALIPFFKKSISYDHVVWATFSAPELASAGMTEAQAHARHGDRVIVHMQDYATLDRAHTDRTLSGHMKIVCDKKGRIVGAHILGARAGDVIHELQVAKVHGIRLDQLQSVIHAYPTYAELVWHSARKAYVQRLERSWWLRILRWLFIG